MSDEWRLVKLSEVADIYSGASLPASLFQPDGPGVRILRGMNIGPARIHWTDAAYWPQSQEAPPYPSRLRLGDICVSMNRALTSSGALRFGRVSQDDLPAVNNQRVARVRAKGPLRPDFLWQVIRKGDLALRVAEMQKGSAVPNITARVLSGFEFLLPPSHEQHRIADLLAHADAHLAALGSSRSVGDGSGECVELERFIEQLREDLLSGGVSIDPAYDALLEQVA